MSPTEEPRIRRYGPVEVALRHRIDRLSLMVTAARDLVEPDGLDATVIKRTYPGILDRLTGLDRARAQATRFRGAMTEACLNDNEAQAELLTLWVDVSETILRKVIGGCK